MVGFGVRAGYYGWNRIYEYHGSGKGILKSALGFEVGMGPGKYFSQMQCLAHFLAGYCSNFAFLYILSQFLAIACSHICFFFTFGDRKSVV